MKLLAAVGLLLAAGLALGGCAETPATVPAPTPTPTSARPTPEPLPSARLQVGTAGSDGLTVRYQDHDGQTRTLRVEDFRR
jgi:hypothetical protein